MTAVPLFSQHLALPFGYGFFRSAPYSVWFNDMAERPFVPFADDFNPSPLDFNRDNDMTAIPKQMNALD
jgi:hypothetical protein